MPIQQRHPMMPLPFTWGMLQRLETATGIDHLLPLFPASVLS